VLPPVVLLLLLVSLPIVSRDVVFEATVFLQARIESVLDVVVNTPWHERLNHHPLISIFLVKLHELEVFGDSPFFFVQVRIHIIVPSFTALLSNTPREESGNLLPFFKAVLGYLVAQDHVLLRSPVSFYLFDCSIFSAISQAEPSIHALNF